MKLKDPIHDGMFSFDNERVNNSPYVLVKDTEGCLELVREGNIKEEGFVRNHVARFDKALARPGFVKSMGSNLNEHRFMLSEMYNRSTYLTKVPRPKAIIDFSKPSERIANLIDKGGDARIDLGNKSSAMIE